MRFNRLLPALLLFAATRAFGAVAWLLPEHQGIWRGTEYLATYGVPVGTPTDVTTCTSAGLVAAISTATGTTNLVRLNCNVTLSGAVDVPTGVTVYSTTAARVGSPTTSDSLRLATSTTVLGLTFTGARPVIVKSTTAQTSIIVAANDFVDVSGQAVYGSATADNTVHTGLTVTRNSFKNCTYAIYGIRHSSSLFTWNEMIGTPGRNIQFIGGSSNTVYGNAIDGGITAVNMLLSASQGYAATNMLDNLIEYNEIYNTGEEAVGGDIQGNTASEIGTFDQFTVEAKSGTATSNPTLQVARTATFDPFNLYAIFHTGALKGRYFRLQAGMTQVTGSSVTFKLRNDVITQPQFDSISVGDRVAIGLVVARTIIRRNIIITGKPVNSVSSAVSIYGNMFDSQVYANVLGGPDDNTDVIRITTLCGLISSNKYASNNDTGNKGCAPVDGNRVFNNLLLNGKIRLRGKTYQTTGNTWLVGTVFSNPVFNNIAPVAANDIWDDATDAPRDSPAPSDGTKIQANTATAAAMLTGGAGINGYKPLPGSPAIGTGLPVWPAVDFRSCPFENDAPSRGPFEVCGGDQSPLRTMSP